MALFPETPLCRCAACEELVRVVDVACPHCGAARARVERATPLVALAAAFAVASCGGPPEPEYGVPLTDSTGSATEANATEVTTEATNTEPTGTTAPTTTDATDTGTTGAARSGAEATESRQKPRAR